ncbi:MAG: ferrous iron transport protein A [Candidatus Omnitrophica bacterium]|nr:ferrous iron transport protein A [Candidatus Omnitrophota bacterium]MBL7210427.1 ferrous iron transport protein A [Candidatus Omnitrophota bacterium]
MKSLSLIQMKRNQKGRVAAISAGHNLQNRLMSMGIYKGSQITKLTHFALRGPVTIKVGRSVLALGHGMAGKVMLEVE